MITDHNTLDWELSADASPTQVLGLEHTHAPDGLPLAATAGCLRAAAAAQRGSGWLSRGGAFLELQKKIRIF